MMKNPFKRLVDRVRGAQPTPSHGPGNAWHTYENPVTKETLRVYNGTPDRMPLHLTVHEKNYVHIAPFDGEPNEQPELNLGDVVWKRATREQREEFVALRVRASIKAMKGQPFKMKPIHIMKHEFRVEAKNLCVVSVVKE